MRISDWSSDVCSSDLRREALSWLWCEAYPHLPEMSGAIADRPAHPSGQVVHEGLTVVVPFMLLIVVLGLLDHFLPEPGVERRQHEQRQQRRRDQAADDDGRQWLLHLSARPLAKPHRHEAEACEDRAHEDGPQPLPCAALGRRFAR